MEKTIDVEKKIAICGMENFVQSRSQLYINIEIKLTKVIYLLLLINIPI